MNGNKDKNIEQISKILAEMTSYEDVKKLLFELLTKSELQALSKRWRILNMLKTGATQREIAKELHVSLCKVTRGSAILKEENAITHKILIKENKNEQQKNEGGWTRLFRQIRR